jgi:hypothetical protein
VAYAASDIPARATATTAVIVSWGLRVDHSATRIAGERSKLVGRHASQAWISSASSPAHE